MKFLIVTYAPTLKKEDKFYSYAPYVYEMNLWSKYITELGIISPIVYTDKLLLSSFKKEPKIFPIQSISVVSFKSSIKSLFRIPLIIIKLFKAMQWADHIHVRCPGNIGLLGSLVQVLFPKKPKTVKYAGNWDPNSKQPLSYRLQKWIISNTFLTRNTKVLVYGEWPNQTKNIVPFFTASYSEKELEQEEQIATSLTPRNDETNCHPEPVEGCDEIAQNSKSLRQAQTDKEKDKQISNQVGNVETNRHPEFISRSHDSGNEKQLLNQVQHDESKIASSQAPRNDETNCHPEPVEGFYNPIKFIFVGALTKGKQPILSVQVIHQLKKKGYNVQLDIYGEGKERENIANYILDNSLENEVHVHGNVSKEIVKSAYQKAQFLLFISKSEGWPKVVAEAMFWGCLPISSAVSCIPYMLANGARGAMVNANADEIMEVVEAYLRDRVKYTVQVQKAMEWSRQYTLEKFEEEIGKLL